MARWNASLHPRDALGRFRPKLVGTEVTVGRGGQYRGAKVAAEFDLGPRGRGGRVLVKGIAGYRPPRTTGGRKVAR